MGFLGDIWPGVAPPPQRTAIEQRVQAAGLTPAASAPVVQPAQSAAIETIRVYCGAGWSVPISGRFFGLVFLRNGSAPNQSVKVDFGGGGVRRMWPGTRIRGTFDGAVISPYGVTSATNFTDLLEASFLESHDGRLGSAFAEFAVLRAPDAMIEDERDPPMFAPVDILGGWLSDGAGVAMATLASGVSAPVNAGGGAAGAFNVTGWSRVRGIVKYTSSPVILTSFTVVPWWHRQEATGSVLWAHLADQHIVMPDPGSGRSAIRTFEFDTTGLDGYMLFQITDDAGGAGTLTHHVIGVA